MKITHNPKTGTSSETERPEELSSWQKMISGIVRPPRSVCKDPLKNLKNFRMNETTYFKTEFIIEHQNKKLFLTIIDPEYKNGWIFLYLHGNSSSKVQALSIRQYLPYQYSLASFDFLGCGQNFEEDKVSLGYRESQQVQTIVNFLKQKGYQTILWGRSMGAATALKYGKASVIVADSAFKSFKSLCKQVAKKNAPCFIPSCLISCLFPCVYSKIRSDIEERAQYDVDNLDISQDIKKISPGTLVIFLSGDEDTLIDKRNSQKLYNMYAGQFKHLQIFKGTHNTKRPPEVLKRIMQKIQQHIKQMQQNSQKGATVEEFIDPPPYS